MMSSQMLTAWFRKVRSRTQGMRGIDRALLLVLAIALPVAVSIWSMVDAVQANRRVLEARLIDAARVNQLELSARLNRYLAAAETIAALPQLQPGGDAAVLGDYLASARAAIGASLISVSSEPAMDMEVLFGNDHVQRGSLIAMDGFPTLARARARMIATKAPTISGVFISPLTQQPAVLVFAPVLDQRVGPTHGAYVRSVALRVDAKIFAEAIAGLPSVPAEFGVTLYDDSDVVIARRWNTEARAGQHTNRVVRPEYVGQNAVLRGYSRTFQRKAVYAFQKLRTAPDWYLAVYAPSRGLLPMVSGPLLRPMLASILVPSLLLAALVLMWRSGRAVRRSELQMDQVLATAPAVIYVDHISADGTRTAEFRSKKVGSLLGFTREQFAALGEDRTRYLDEKAAAMLKDFYDRVGAHGSANVELPVRHPDGRERVMRIDESCIERDAAGGMRVTGFVTDVTAEAEAKERRRHVERLATLGEVTAGIAHEMNQPLAAISMAVENAARALGRVPPDVSRVADKLEMVRAQVQRIAKVIGHIRVFGRDDVDRNAAIDIGQVIDEALILVEAKLRRERIQLTRAIPDPPPRLRGVAVMLEQVLMNIVGNAVDAYRDRPELPDRHIDISVSERGSDAVIAITDHAGGIPPGVLGHIFDAFFTTKPAGHGTGLGLSISLATVREMGGSLSASNVDDGARFEIALPMAAAAALA